MEVMVIEVNGVPDIEPHERIADKLKMHFLRRSNCGADVLIVLYPTSIDGQAYVVFESKEVPGVLACFHVLEVDNKFYPLNIKQVNQSEMDMEVEATLDMSAFKRPRYARQLIDYYSGLRVTEHSQGQLILRGYFLNLKLLYSQLTQLLTQDMQNDSSSPSDYVNGHSSMPVSQKVSYSQGTRATFTPQKHVTDGTMYAGSRSPMVNGSSDSHKLPLPKPASPLNAASGTYMSPRNLSNLNSDSLTRSPYSTSPSPYQVSFPVDTDVLNFMLTYRQEYIQEIGMKYNTEMTIKDSDEFTTVTFQGADCERAKASFMNLYEKIGPSLRSQEIHLSQYDSRSQAQICKRIARYNDLGVFIKRYDNIVKLVGSSQKSFEVMQLLLGNKEYAESSERGRKMERDSKGRRSFSLTRRHKESVRAVNAQDYSPDPEHQASVAKDYSPMKYQEEQIVKAQLTVHGQPSKKERSVPERNHKQKKEQPKGVDGMDLTPRQEKSPKKSLLQMKYFKDIEKKIFKRK